MEEKKIGVLDKFTIKDIESLTDIKAHTLRVWEQRYDFLKPKRTDTNIRFFDTSDLKLLLNIALLNKNGYRISDIAKMTPEEMSRKITRIATQDFEADSQIKSLTYTMLDLNEDEFEQIVEVNIEKMGFEACMLQVLFPFLNNIGILWMAGTITPAHEHFISNLIRRKIIVATDSQKVKTMESCKRFLLFLPENEFHELGLLFSNYLIRSRGHKAVYLGQSVPMSDLPQIKEIYKPDYFYCVATTTPSDMTIQEYVDGLKKTLPEEEIWLSGREVITKNPTMPDKFRVIMDFQEVIREIEKL